MFIVAFLFIGIGVGMFTNSVAAGTLLGLGLGFLVEALIKVKKRTYRS